MRRIGVLTALTTALFVVLAMLTPSAAFATPPNTTISGTITSAQTGAPVAGIDVWAVTDPATDNPPRTNTNPDGSYTLTVTPGIDYKILILDGSSDAYQETYIGTRDINPGEATTFHGGDTDADGTVYRLNEIQGQLNYVQDGHTYSASQVVVDVYYSNGTIAGGGETEGDGSFTVFTGDVDDETYKVRFSDPNNNTFQTSWYSGKSSEDSATPVTVAGGGVASLDTQTLAVSAIINGYVVDSLGNSLDGIPVSLIDSSGDVVASTTSDGGNDGIYQLKGLPSGTFHVRFGTPGATDWASGWWLDSSNPANTVIDAKTAAESDSVTLSPGVTVNNVFDYLQAASSVSGTILAGVGGVLPGATVQLVDAANQVVAEYETGGDGLYHFNGLQTGSYTVRATEDGYIGESLPVSLNSESSDASGFDITLNQAGTVHGTISDADGPVVGATVTLYLDNASVASTTSGDGGAYSFGGLVGGDYTIAVAKAKHSAYVSDSFTLDTGDSVETDATLVKFGKISGQVIDPETTNGIPGVTVTLKRGGTAYGTATTDSNGGYSFSDLPAGTYQAVVKTGDAGNYFGGQLAEDSGVGATDLVVTDGVVVGDVDVNLERGEILAGTVTAGDLAGTPGFSGVTVNLHPWVGLPTVNLPTTQTTTTDSDGHYSFFVHRGDYSIEVVPTGEPAAIYPTRWWLAGAPGGTLDPLSASNANLEAYGSELDNANVALQPYPNLNATLPHLSGKAKVGSTLTATFVAWGPGTPTITHGWYRTDVLIPGATGMTYKLTNADAGHTITFQVTGSESGFLTSTAPSAATAVVTGGTLTLHTPTISGSHVVGQLLTASATFTSPSGTISYTYEWKRGSSAIKHATASTYRLTSSDAGKKITVKVTGHETGFTTASRTSGSVTIQKVLSATPTPKITGTVAGGHKVTASAGKWKPSKVTLHYQWNLNGTPIVGATRSTFAIPLGSSGSLTVSVTGSKSGYTSVTKTSSAKVVS